mmetsp:Transcript_21611/g.43146  ORF Transcript_21611/g.43146 Transcript_21611/m.43146 type:complete len:248 (-) Transcript_21611:1051-1794(-)
MYLTPLPNLPDLWPLLAMSMALPIMPDMPPPPPPPPPPMGGPPPPPAPGCSDLGLRTVSSILRMTHAASPAAAREFTLLMLGSQTLLSNVSQMPPVSMSTPYHCPLSPWKCFFLRELRMSVASKPALSASWRGTISRALAKACMTSCPLPSIFMLSSLRNLLTSISTAPPPATTERDLRDRFTTMMASWMERWDSSMNCSEPPRRTMVAVSSEGHSVKRLKRSSPTCFSSKWPHFPRIPSSSPLTLV